MIVYGDHAEQVRVADALTAIDARLAALPAAGLDRHAVLVGAFIALGQLVQGVADAGLRDEKPLMDRLVSLAHAVLASWALLHPPVAQHGTGDQPQAGGGESGEAGSSPPPSFKWLPSPSLRDREEEVVLKLPEGYAFYALYPEAYAAAARCLKLLGPPRVVGIRSIGTGLAAIVAAALDAPRPLTVRPLGHPFDRWIAPPPDVERALRDDRGEHFVIVDEGPGLSGSSFAAVARWLEERGVPRARIAFLPGHGGMPGAQATPATRALWSEVQRTTVAFDRLIPPNRLAEWIAPLVGAPEAPEPVGRGSQLKFLARSGNRRWLIKFAGLGWAGERKLEIARRLAEAGLIAPVAGLAHGFLVQEWLDAATPERPTSSLVDAIAGYLGARATLLADLGGQGASLDALHGMARFNIEQALGPELAARLPRPAGNPRRYPTDNRLDLAKWLQLSGASVRKADALDHHRAHDLIGCQDLAWDVAGATVELGLDSVALERFATRVGECAGCPVDRALLGFYLPCYGAFRLGAERLSGGGREGFYADRLRTLLSAEQLV